MNMTAYAAPQPGPEQYQPGHLRLVDSPAAGPVGNVAVSSFVPDHAGLSSERGGAARPSAPRHSRDYDSSRDDTWTTAGPRGPIAEDAARRLAVIDRLNAMPRHGRGYDESSAGTWARSNPQGPLAEDPARRLTVIDRLNAMRQPETAARPNNDPASWDPMSDYRRRASVDGRMRENNLRIYHSPESSMSERMAASRALGAAAANTSRPYTEGKAEVVLTPQQQADQAAMQYRLATKPYYELIQDRTAA